MAAKPSQWVADEKVSHCFKCSDEFGFFKRKHHCRSCGNIFCGNCCVNAEKSGTKAKLCHSCVAFEVGGQQGESSQHGTVPSLPRMNSKTAGLNAPLSPSRQHQREQQIDTSIALEGDELNRVFNQLIAELGIPAESMANLPPSKKWVLITQHKDKVNLDLKKTNTADDTSSPRYYISLLESKLITKEQITHLKISLNSYTISWITEFIKLGGIGLLTALLSNDRMKSKEREEAVVELEVILCLKAIMNTKVGLPNISQRADVPNNIIPLLMSPDLKVKTNLTEILAVICMSDAVGHQNVLKAFRLFKELTKEEMRFSMLVKSLSAVPHVEDYLVNAMSLINCMVNSPHDLATRVRLRGNFLSLGILNIIKTLRSLSDPNLMVQLDVFEDALESDANEVKSSGAEITTIDEEDPNKIFATLKNMAEGSPYKEPFLQTLRFLLDFSTDSSTGPKIWAIFESISAQLMKLRDSQEVSEKDEGDIVVGSSNTSQVLKEKNRLIQQVKAVEKMYQAATTQIEALKKEREEKNKIVSALMSQVKEMGAPTAPLSNTPATPVQGLKKGALDSPAHKSSEDQALHQRMLELETINKDLETKCYEYLKRLEQVNSVPTSAIVSTSSASPTGDEPPSSPENIPETTAPHPSGPPPPPPSGGPPPPPPPPPSGGPPPPPPPPGAPPPPPPSGGPPPPPPPMGKKKSHAVTGSNQPGKKYLTPTVKMKVFNWTKLPNNQVANTVWEKLDDTAIKIDVTALEKMFCAHVVEVHVQKEKSTTVTLIDPRKANNCAIMLTRFKSIGLKELKAAILSVDENILDPEGAKGLATFAPTQEDIAVITSYEGDPNILGKAEQFYKEIMGIPRISQRLECISFMLSFGKLLNDVKPDIEAVLLASEEVHNSKRLRSLIEVVLAVGNFINGGSSRGAAAGFRLESLLKIRDTQSNSPLIPTALHYIISFIAEHHPQLLSFHEDLPHVESAAKANAAGCQSALNTLKKGLDAITTEISKPHDPEFLNKLKVFHEARTSEYKKVEERAVTMDANFKELTKFYGEPTTKPEEFFSIFDGFITSFLKTQEDLKSKKEAAEKEQKRKHMESLKAKVAAKPQEAGKLTTSTEKAHQQQQPGKETAPGTAGSAADIERGGMDNMIAAIRAGAAFRRNNAG